MSCKVPEVDEGPGLEVGICGGGGPGRCHGIRSAAEAAKSGRIRRKAAADENESDGDDGVRRREGQVTSTARSPAARCSRDTGESTRRSGGRRALRAAAKQLCFRSSCPNPRFRDEMYVLANWWGAVFG